MNTKALIVCAFVLVYAKSRFSNDAGNFGPNVPHLYFTAEKYSSLHRNVPVKLKGKLWSRGYKNTSCTTELGMK